MNRRIQVLELAGLPASGKTTVAPLLQAALTEKGYRCVLVDEKAAQSPLVEYKRDWRFNAWTLCESLTCLLEQEHDQAYDWVILDRGLVDALCWVEWHRRTGSIREEDARAFAGFIRIPTWFRQVALAVVLRVGFDTALRRRGETGRILNEPTFRQLGEAYDRALAAPDVAQRCLEIRTDLLTPNAVVEQVLTALHEGARPGVSIYRG